MDHPADLNANPLPSSIFPIRHVWYQSQIEVVVDLLVKRVRGNDLTCDVQPDAFTITFRTPDGVLRSFGFDHLRHEILPSKSTVQVFPTRVEIRLRKKEPGIKWVSIEGESLHADGQASETKAELLPKPLPLPPSYQSGALTKETESALLSSLPPPLPVTRPGQVTLPHTFHSVV